MMNSGNNGGLVKKLLTLTPTQYPSRLLHFIFPLKRDTSNQDIYSMLCHFQMLQFL